MKTETRLIRTQVERSDNKEHSVPLYMTSSYVFDDADHMAALFNDEEEGYIYSRYSNPNISEFVQKVADLERTETGWATASGMAAIFSVFGAFLESGDEILSSRSVFGSTHKLFTEILPKWGIKTTYVDFDDVDNWADSINKRTKILYLETPTNPGVDIIDLAKVGVITKQNGLLYVVDNCFATPINQKPADFGADLVIHSATKYFDGQGRTMGGIILGSEEHILKIQGFARHTGPALSPFNAWTLSKSLETLALRVERHNDNALEIAKRLEKHEAVEWVKYPFLASHPQYEIAKSQMKGGGGIVTFEVKGGLEKGKSFLNSLKMLSLTANLGDSRSIATHPASTTHSKLTEEDRMKVGISPGLIRISAGLEHLEDIWADIEQALS
ncbi:aminotransferase class I/II-fold pyridoxal phosphate-dependent enzyme [Paracrocinitomix mangrovi]|uniref:trans-sulfuration enzyme family protein n=1 Tax=Paracrocinitomix mangrovi TaxID=2862509 RepID=UPI001C8E38A9|nr:aminotransferase class I/II-fold pyridoxal phosphate-dependent enzyme [Paracrocinitomix mangrovi]UKN02198.1 aminotransferase class I/II-fold pyridoxal phosphate-dependent enzyme [Paracrocinitomix mangrovi]